MEKQGLGHNKSKIFAIVLQDANNKKQVITKGGSYYSCAKFIQKYHKSFTFKKTKYEMITCCNAWPRECGGVCCRRKRQYDAEECGCYKIPSSIEHINNCYDDCCNIFKYTSKRKFYLQWTSK